MAEMDLLALILALLAATGHDPTANLLSQEICQARVLPAGCLI